MKDLALTKDKRMVAVKHKFSEVTKLQVTEFFQQTVDLCKEFKATGPATAGTNTGPDGAELTLEEGLDLLKVISVIFFDRYFLCSKKGAIPSDGECRMLLSR